LEGTKASGRNQEDGAEHQGERVGGRVGRLQVQKKEGGKQNSGGGPVTSEKRTFLGERLNGVRGTEKSTTGIERNKLKGGKVGLQHQQEGLRIFKGKGKGILLGRGSPSQGIGGDG